MSEPKTKVNEVNPNDFIAAIEEPAKRTDSQALLELFSNATNEVPKMWGSNIIGFGQYHYKSDRSSQEGDWMLTGFSPRKQNLSLYILPGFDDYSDLLDKLGKYKTAKSCLYISKLSDVNVEILSQLISRSYEDMKANNL